MCPLPREEEKTRTHNVWNTNGPGAAVNGALMVLFLGAVHIVQLGGNGGDAVLGCCVFRRLRDTLNVTCFNEMPLYATKTTEPRV